MCHVPFLLNEPKTHVKGMKIEWLLNKGILAKSEFELECYDCTQQLCPLVTIGHIFLHVVGNECEMSETSAGVTANSDFKSIPMLYRLKYSIEDAVNARLGSMAAMSGG